MPKKSKLNTKTEENYNEKIKKENKKEQREIPEGSVTSKQSIVRDGKLLIDDPELKKIIEQSKLNYENWLKQGKKTKDDGKKEEDESENDEDENNEEGKKKKKI